MIQAITETDLKIYVQTEDNRINTSVASTQIRHLVKFTNDLDKSIYYAYGSSETIKDRFTNIDISYGTTPNIYTGVIKLFPAGYYKYEIYEVSWTGTVTVSSGNAPATEDDVLIPAASILRSMSENTSLARAWEAFSASSPPHNLTGIFLCPLATLAT